MKRLNEYLYHTLKAMHANCHFDDKVVDELDMHQIKMLVKFAQWAQIPTPNEEGRDVHFKGTLTNKIAEAILTRNSAYQNTRG